MLTRRLIGLGRDEAARQHVGPDRVVMLLDGWAFAAEAAAAGRRFPHRGRCAGAGRDRGAG